MHKAALPCSRVTHCRRVHDIRHNLLCLPPWDCKGLCLFAQRQNILISSSAPCELYEVYATEDLSKAGCLRAYLRSCKARDSFRSPRARLQPRDTQNTYMRPKCTKYCGAHQVT